MRHTSVITLCLFTLLTTLCQTTLAEPRTFRLDNDHTHIVWQVDRFGFSNTVGSFTEVQGTVVFDEAQPTNSSVDASIALAGLRSDLPEREDIVRGPHWLGAAEHPLITFQSTSVVVSEATACEGMCLTVMGEMTLRGVTAPVSLKVRLNKVGKDPVSQRTAAGFSAVGAFDRSEFGIATALGPVGDTVHFEIQALAIADTTDGAP